jgi:hypothetical protein
MYDSVDVTLTNPIINADSLQPPEVARTLVVARFTPTPTQQFLHVKVVVVAMNYERMLNNKQDKEFSKAYAGSTEHCLPPIPRIWVHHRLQAKLETPF